MKDGEDDDIVEMPSINLPWALPIVTIKRSRGRPITQNTKLREQQSGSHGSTTFLLNPSLTQPPSCINSASKSCKQAGSAMTGKSIHMERGIEVTRSRFGRKFAKLGKNRTTPSKMIHLLP